MLVWLQSALQRDVNCPFGRVPRLDRFEARLDAARLVGRFMTERWRRLLRHWQGG